MTIREHRMVQWSVFRVTTLLLLGALTRGDLHEVDFRIISRKGKFKGKKKKNRNVDLDGSVRSVQAEESIEEVLSSK